MVIIILRCVKENNRLTLKVLNNITYFKRLNYSLSRKIKKEEGAYYYIDLSPDKFSSKHNYNKKRFINVIDEYPKNKNMFISETCVICLERSSKVILLRCGHLCLCFNCFMENITACPLCRINISNIVVI